MKAKPKTCQLSEFYIKLFDIVINLIFNIVLFHMLIDYLYSD
jgi:hypothetical protein